MRKFDGILLCSDFDGTLAYHNMITKANCEAIKYFQSNGGIFTVISGRQPSFVKEYNQYFVPNTYICGLNGTLIKNIESGECVYSDPLDADYIDILRTILETNREITSVELQCEFENKRFKQNQNKWDLDGMVDICPVYKMVFIVPDQYSDSINELIMSLFAGRYCVSRSWKNGIEIQSISSNKGTAVTYLRALLQEKAKLVIGVGDYENDIPLFKSVNLSYAVENALESVKFAANRVTSRCDEDSIAKIIFEIEEQFTKST